MSQVKPYERKWKPSAASGFVFSSASPMNRKPAIIRVGPPGEDIFTATCEAVDKALVMMSLCRRHTFQVVTDEPYRASVYFESLTTPNGPDPDRWDSARNPIYRAAMAKAKATRRLGDLQRAEQIGVMGAYPTWPLPNLHLGVRVKNQKEADERIPYLLKCPAAVRMVCIEGMEGAIDIERYFYLVGGSTAGPFKDALGRRRGGPGGIGGQAITAIASGDIQGVTLAGGKNPIHPAWVRSIRDQCAAAGVPFFFGGYGEWGPLPRRLDDGTEDRSREHVIAADGTLCVPADLSYPDGPRHSEAAYAKRGRAQFLTTTFPVGKAYSGRTLDGRTHDELPGVSREAVPA